MEREVPFRPATLRERSDFYKKEFSLKKVAAWFRKYKLPLPQICALDAGSDTHILKKKFWANTLLYIKFDELLEKIAEYLPEDIYYDRSVYSNPDAVLKSMRFSGALQQELVFDVDAENIECTNRECKGMCRKCLQQAYAAALALERALHRRFTQTTLVYSGRGFHLHVLDRKAFLMSNRERARLSAYVARRFPIDPWVSRGHIRLIRLPFSLHGEVSRIVTPLGAPCRFVPEKTIPSFLRLRH